LVFAALALGLGAVGCTEEQTTPAAPPALAQYGADAVLTGLRHNITLDGVREGELFADTAFQFRDSSSVYHLINPTLELFEEGTGNRRAQVEAEWGRFNPATREMLARGNVVLVISEGNRRVESQELNYAPAGDRIWSDSFTTMTEPGRISEGLGFDSDLEFRTATVGPGSIRNTGGGTEAGAEVPPPAGGRPTELPDTGGGVAMDTVPDPVVGGRPTVPPDTGGIGRPPEGSEPAGGRRLRSPPHPGRTGASRSPGGPVS
jgi:LPS export ABC transporter protein LptC